MQERREDALLQRVKTCRCCPTEVTNQLPRLSRKVNSVRTEVAIGVPSSVGNTHRTDMGGPMAKHDSYLRMTEDDLRAGRVLTLAVKFFGTSRPVASSTIWSDLYPDLDEGSFKRQFLRDRELLDSFGIAIREVSDTQPDTLWRVDERNSYVSGDGLSADDARMLYVLCHDMAFDQAFPYRDELRMALAKIARMYPGGPIVQSDQTASAEHKLLALLVSCMNNLRAADVTYTDAKGSTSKRTIAILGSFGLRGHTYFVASRIERDGTLTPDSIRTYRLDRFERVRESRNLSYQIPPDFSVSDYERLPFQIGDSAGTACFLVDGAQSKQLSRAMSIHGCVRESGGATVWDVPYSDAQLAASWAIGSGIVPLEPKELTQRWGDTLRAALGRDAHDPSLAGAEMVQPTAASRKRAGRKGSIATARQLVALATSLTRQGEVISAQDIATTLGTSYDEARHLIALVSMGSGEAVDYLPVIISDSDDEVALMEGALLNVRSIRLTRSETIALQAALTELGVASDDPLVQTLSNAYVAPSFTASDVARSFEAPSSASDTNVLKQCSKAISSGKGLIFSYTPVSGGTTSTRRVIPQLVRRSDDSWYLDAYDLMRCGPRVFRIDRMADVRAVSVEASPSAFETSHQSTQTVVVRFEDRRYLDLFPWDGIQVLSTDDRGVVTRLPMYGGSWLARHLVACAGTVQVSDAALATQMHDYALALTEAHPLADEA